MRGSVPGMLRDAKVNDTQAVQRRGCAALVAGVATQRQRALERCAREVELAEPRLHQALCMRAPRFDAAVGRVRKRLAGLEQMRKRARIVAQVEEHQREIDLCRSNAEPRRFQ